MMFFLALGIVLLVVIAPWPFASVAPAVHRWEMLAVCIGLALVIAQRFATILLTTRTRTDDKPAGPANASSTPINWVLIAALLWAGMQLVPLPAELVEFLSPHTARIWEMSRSFEERAEHLGWLTFSLQPEATFRSIVLFSMAAGAFLLAASVGGFRSVNHRRPHDAPSFSDPGSVPIASWLVPLAFGLTGLALAVFGIVQQFTWNGRIYWTYTFPWVADPFGPFVNRNNAAGCLNMAAGMCLVGLTAAGLKLWNDRRICQAVAVASVGVIAVLAAAILRSGSRGGLLSMVVAAMAVLLALASRRARRPLLWVAAAALPLAAGVALAIWLGMDPKLWQRYQTLQRLSTYQHDARVVNWGAAYRAFLDVPITGTGFGTYRYAYQPFENRDAGQWLLHAENVFVETMLEGGLPGLALLLAGLGMVGGSFIRKLGRMAAPEQTAAAAGGLYLLVSQSAHNCMDLGAYVPANLLWGSIGLGWAYGLCTAAGRKSRASGFTPVRARWGELLVAVALAAGMFGYWRFAPVAGLVRTIERAEERRETFSLDELHATIARLEDAIARYPLNAESHLAIAELYIKRWRQESLDKGVEPNQASLEMLYARAVAAVRNGDPERLSALRLDALVARDLRAAWRHIQRARRLCPLMARAHLRAGQLAWLTRDDFPEMPYFEFAVWCGRANPAILIPAASFQLMAGKHEEARRLLSRVWRLDPKRGERLAELFQMWFNPEEILGDHEAQGNRRAPQTTGPAVPKEP
ncbi:MAG: hypothetical protein KatS3mg109_2103 [Pirellulaceae bacterium]|nr:MAG: hypothetical protein KatS3mg109_2103 [Pirellulaceae bacterium]